jgi:hypothetical protein
MLPLFSQHMAGDGGKQRLIGHPYLLGVEMLLARALKARTAEESDIFGVLCDFRAPAAAHGYA